MRANFGGISAKLKFGYSTAATVAKYGYSARQYAIIRSQLVRAQNAFIKAGGKAQNLKNAILNGRGNQGHAINGLAGLEGADIMGILESILAILKTIGGIVAQLKPHPVDEEDDSDEPEADKDGQALAYVDPIHAQKPALLTALADNYLSVGRRLFIGCMRPDLAAYYGIPNAAWQRYRLYYINTARKLAEQAGVTESELHQCAARAWQSSLVQLALRYASLLGQLTESELHQCAARAWQSSLAGPYRSAYQPYIAWLTVASWWLDQIDATT